MPALPLPPPGVPLPLIRNILLGGILTGIAGGLVVKSSVDAARATSAARRKGLFLRPRPPRERRCPRCTGFRIAACDLCGGRGVCEYRRRFTRVIPCPRCTLRRYTVCEACSGSGLRNGSVLRRSLLGAAGFVRNIFEGVFFEGRLEGLGVIGVLLAREKERQRLRLVHG